MPSAVREPKPAREEVLSLEVLARREPEEENNQPTQFRVLVRHFLDRFFNNEMASADGDAKTRLVQVACTIGIPPFVVALYLYPLYHLPRGRVGNYWGARPYWAQAGDHYFYVLYSMVAMGIVTIFEWDLLFPDLLDVFVLSSLPVRAVRMLGARVAAIFILLGAALFDSSFLAPVVLPAAMDPPHLLRFWAAHLLAVAASGIFGAAFFLALEGILVGVMGDRLFRKIALWLQGAFVVSLLTLLFLYPAIAGSLGAVLQSHNHFVGWVPPFWFLGIYQRILDGPATPTVFAGLASTGWIAVTVVVVLAVVSYPLAWWRRTRALVEGTAKRERLNRIALPLRHAVHVTLARKPVYRAMWQFIGQNLLRVPRYRMVLVMYGGMGAALLLCYSYARERDPWTDWVRFFTRGAARDGAHRGVLDGVWPAQHVSCSSRSARPLDFQGNPGEARLRSRGCCATVGIPVERGSESCGGVCFDLGEDGAAAGLALCSGTVDCGAGTEPAADRCVLPQREDDSIYRRAFELGDELRSVVDPVSRILSGNRDVYSGSGTGDRSQRRKSGVRCRTRGGGSSGAANDASEENGGASARD